MLARSIKLSYLIISFTVCPVVYEIFIKLTHYRKIKQSSRANYNKTWQNTVDNQPGTFSAQSFKSAYPIELAFSFPVFINYRFAVFILFV